MSRFALPQHSSCRREAYRALTMGTSARARSALTGAISLGSQKSKGGEFFYWRPLRLAGYVWKTTLVLVRYI